MAMAVSVVGPMQWLFRDHGWGWSVYGRVRAGSVRRSYAQPPRLWSNSRSGSGSGSAVLRSNAPSARSSGCDTHRTSGGYADRSCSRSRWARRCRRARCPRRRLPNASAGHVRRLPVRGCTRGHSGRASTVDLPHSPLTASSTRGDPPPAQEPHNSWVRIRGSPQSPLPPGVRQGAIRISRGSDRNSSSSVGMTP